MVKTQRVTVVGVGAWGTVLALQLLRNGHQVALWSHDTALADELRRSRINQRFLPGFALPDALDIYSDEKAALTGADAVVFVTASPFLRSTIERFIPYLNNDIRILNATKGLEEGTNQTMLDIYQQTLSTDQMQRWALLSGPNLSLEVAQQLPTTTVIASENQTVAHYFQLLFNASTFRVYTNSDVKGVQTAGTLKNVMALAAGILEGLGFGYNARAGLMVRGLAEMTRLGLALGAQRATFYG